MSLYGGIEIVGKPDLENVRRLDLLPCKAVAEMQRFGFPIDKDHFSALSEKLAQEMKELRYRICSYVPESKLDEFIAKSGMDADDEYLPMNVDSRVQIAKLLFEVLGIGRGRQLKRTKSGDQISTGKRQMEQLRKDHEIVPLVLEYREYAKLKGTYTDKIPAMAVLHTAGRCERCSLDDFVVEHDAPTLCVHTTILATRTSTGRYSSKDPNLQNVPVRSKYGQQVRAGFVAPAGMELWGADFSQLQLRFLAHSANEEKMQWIFNEGKDPHTMTAMWAFGLDNESQVDKLTQRAPAKNVNFAIAFGETAKGLHEQLLADSYGKSGIEVPEWLTLEWCEGFLLRWHELYPAVLPYMEQQYYRARRYGVVWDMFGRVRRVPEVRSVHKRVVAAGLRQAGNHPIQAPDSAVMRLALAEVQAEVAERVRKEGIRCWLVMTIHDELIGAVDKGYGELCRDLTTEIMERVLVDRETGESMCRVKIKAEGTVMERWTK